MGARAAAPRQGQPGAPMMRDPDPGPGTPTNVD
jgi:hypothetical protein